MCRYQYVLRRLFRPIRTLHGVDVRFRNTLRSTSGHGRDGNVWLFGAPLQNIEQYLIRLNLFGLRFEVQDNAVPQCREVDTSYIFKADIETPFQE